MKRILTETTYDIPYDRWVDLKLTGDDGKPVLVYITRPSGFEKRVFEAKYKKDKLMVYIPKRIIGNFLRPTKVNLTAYQNVEDVQKVEEPVVVEKVVLNPVPIKTEKKPGIIERIKTGKIRPVDFKSQAIEDTKKRKERLTQVRSEVNISTALKPTGWDGKRILTGDDCDYSLGVSIIPNLIRIEEAHNKSDNAVSTLGDHKLLCEYYDLFSFCGIESIIGLYMAAGHKTTGCGSLEYLKRWWVNELSKIYSPTNFGNIKKTGSGMMNALRPKPLKKRPNPGLSIKNAES
ncbi:hypothetical protein KA005_69315, partial [bacterium]|nr:hypothetical protein [bacterium]